jgi:hypothetical protein
MSRVGDLRDTTSGSHWELKYSNAGGIARGWGQFLSCDSCVLLLGGFDSEGRCLSDVLVSFNGGESWIAKTSRAPWSGRAVFGACVSACGSCLYVIGGVCPDKGGFVNDIWLSTDLGETWVSQSGQDTPWEPRSGFACCINPNDPSDISIFGGSTARFSCLSDVWRTTDGGVSWKHVANAPWSPRVDMACTQDSKGVIYLAGGDDWDGNFFNDFWVSDNRGKSWKCVNNSCPWPARAGHAIVIEEIKTFSNFVLFAGNSSGLKPQKANDDQHIEENIRRHSDIWKSFDRGSSWVHLAGEAEFGERTMMRAVVHKQEIYALGGWVGTDVTTGQNLFTADMWISRGDKKREIRERGCLIELFTTQLSMEVCIAVIFPFLYGN